MLYNMKVTALFLLFSVATIAAADQSINEIAVYEIEEQPTEPPAPSPYVFSYTAGRYPGHADRTHSEVSDGSGIVRGTFSYVDPRQQIRTVDYTADKNGFHPVLSHPAKPQEQSAAVQLETQRQAALFNKIANERAHPELAQTGEQPRDTVAVEHAKQKHYSLFEKIAQDHARIAAEREQERLTFEATSEVYTDDELHYQKH